MVHMTRKKMGWDSYLPILLVLYKRWYAGRWTRLLPSRLWEERLPLLFSWFFILSLLLIPSVFFLFYFLLASLCFLSPLSLYASALFFLFPLFLSFFVFFTSVSPFFPFYYSSPLGQHRQRIYSLYTALIRKDSMH